MLIVSLLAAVCMAGDPINTNWQGLAVKGYDVVAYFSEGAPVKGVSAFAQKHDGVKYYFASQANKDLFLADPQKYLPQFGGYCAWAVSQGSKADIDPKAWTVIEGKLYLNYSPNIQQKWAKDIPGNIERGNQNWPGLKEK